MYRKGAEKKDVSYKKPYAATVLSLHLFCQRDTRRGKLWIACPDFFQKSGRANVIRPALFCPGYEKYGDQFLRVE